MNFAFSGCLIKAGSLNVLFLLFLKYAYFGKGLAEIVFQAAYGAEIGSLKMASLGKTLDKRLSGCLSLIGSLKTIFPYNRPFY